MSKSSGLVCNDVALPTEASEADVDTGDISLYVVEAGPEDGELVVLLHGFPECWYAWADYIRPLTEAGYRVVIPDQRGYNLSDKPNNIGAYRLDELAFDVIGLIDAYDRERAHIVGHDWGGAVAWWTALHHEDRVASLTVMNLPHPAVFARHLRRDPRQQLRSWYVLFFQLPRLPEFLSSIGDWRTLHRMMVDSALPGTFSSTDFDHYRAAWNVPGAFTAMVNWYRAIVRDRPTPKRMTVQAPTLIIWGAKDRYLTRSMARESLAHCKDGHLRVFEEATHWVHHEEPVTVAHVLVEHLDDRWRTPNNTPDEAGHRVI